MIKEKEEKLLVSLQENFKEWAVQPEELKETIEALLITIRDLRLELNKKLVDTKSEAGVFMLNVHNNLNLLEQKVGQLTATEGTTLAQIQELSKRLESDIIKIETNIPQVPDLQLDIKVIEKKVKEVEKKIPTKFDTPEQIRDKLETLKKDDRLDASAIKGLGKKHAKLTDDILNRAIGIVDQRTSYLIQKVSNLTDKVNSLGSGSGHIIEDEGTPLTQRTNMNFVGAGVSVADAGGKTVVTVTGSSTGITRIITAISSPTTGAAAATVDYVYLVSGTTTFTLPTAVGNTNLYTVKNVGSNTVTVATTSAQTIDGSSTASMPVANTALSFISDDSNWCVV